MALIKWGMMVVDGRGKLGGHVLTKSRNGATVRTKVTPANPQTSYQQQNRAVFGQLSSNWSALTESERKAWNGAVGAWQKTNIFGDLKTPAGRDLYISLNRNILLAGGTEIDTPPQKEGIAPNAIKTFEVDPVNSEVFVELVNTLAADEVALVYMTKPMSAGRYNFSGSYRFLIAEPSEIARISYADYADRFGSLIDGEALGVKVVVCNQTTGEVSPPMIRRLIIAL